MNFSGNNAQILVFMWLILSIICVHLKAVIRGLKLRVIRGYRVCYWISLIELKGTVGLWRRYALY